MDVQTYTNTKLRTKEFIYTNLPFSKENIFVRTHNNGNAYDYSFANDELSSWRDICDSHLNEERAMLNELTSDTTIDEISQIDKIDSSTNRLENFIAERFLAINSVEFVFLSLEKDSIDIWTVINKLDRKVRGKVYEVEYEILGFFKEFQFDFHAMCRDDRNIEEVRPFGAKMIFRK